MSYIVSVEYDAKPNEDFGYLDEPLRKAARRYPGSSGFGFGGTRDVQFNFATWAGAENLVRRIRLNPALRSVRTELYEDDLEEAL